jgi:hypothetical protein
VIEKGLSVTLRGYVGCDEIIWIPFGFEGLRVGWRETVAKVAELHAVIMNRHERLRLLMHRLIQVRQRYLRWSPLHVQVMDRLLAVWGSIHQINYQSKTSEGIAEGLTRNCCAPFRRCKSAKVVGRYGHSSCSTLTVFVLPLWDRRSPKSAASRNP